MPGHISLAGRLTKTFGNTQKLHQELIKMIFIPFIILNLKMTVAVLIFKPNHSFNRAVQLLPQFDAEGADF